jgi:hypothetical protein
MTYDEAINKLREVGFEVEASDHHICKYCGGIARGPDEDRLCDECKEIFGHAFFSEL